MEPKLVFETDALKLRVCRTEKFKAGLLSVSAVLPIGRESAPLTSLLLSVLRRGTVKYPTLEILNRRLDYLYGTELAIRNFYRGDGQIIGFTAELLDSSFLPADEDLTGAVLDVLCQILFHPLLDENGMLSEKYVESEKQFQCEAIRSLKNNPRAYAVERCNELLYRDEPCGASVYGTEEEIMAVTPALLTSFWRMLISSLSVECFYVGAANTEQLQGALQKTLCAELARVKAEGLTAPSAVKAVRRAAEATRVDEEMAAGQSQLLLGFTTDTVIGTPEFHACIVLNDMLGVSPVSRLFVNVREKLSLCYHCGSSYNSFKGTILVHCGVHRDNRARAEEEILRQVSLLAAGDFDDDELEAAKKSLMATYRQIEDSSGATESFCFGRSLAGFDEDAAQCCAHIDAVTRDAVIAAANRLALHTVYFLDGTLADGGEEETDEDD